MSNAHLETVRWGGLGVQLLNRTKRMKSGGTANLVYQSANLSKVKPGVTLLDVDGSGIGNPIVPRCISVEVGKVKTWKNTC